MLDFLYFFAFTFTNGYSPPNDNVCDVVQKVCAISKHPLCMYADTFCKKSCYLKHEHTESIHYWNHQDEEEQTIRATMQSLFFRPYFGADKNAIDLGGGAGFFLKTLPHKNAFNVESNPLMRNYSEYILKIPAVPSLAYVPDGWANVIMSDMALEHMTDPVSQLLICRQKLAKDGHIVIIVPGPKAFGRWSYKLNDLDHHLWAWDSQLLGNLLETAGFVVKSIKLIPYTHAPKLYKSHSESEWLHKVEKMNRNPLLFAVAQPKKCVSSLSP